MDLDIHNIKSGDFQRSLLAVQNDNNHKSQSNSSSGGGGLSGVFATDSYVMHCNRRIMEGAKGDVASVVWQKAVDLGVSGGGSVSQQIEAIRLMENKVRRARSMKDVGKKSFQ